MTAVSIKELGLPSGDKVVLFGYDSCVDKIERQQNIVCFDSRGNEKWRVGEYGAWENSAFTNIYFLDGGLYAYNFDGGEYSIDMGTGQCRPVALLK